MKKKNKKNLSIIVFPGGPTEPSHAYSCAPQQSVKTALLVKPNPEPLLQKGLLSPEGKGGVGREGTGSQPAATVTTSGGGGC